MKGPSLLSMESFIIILAISLSFAGCNKKSKKNSFSFAFITDIHLQSESRAVQGFLKAIDTIINYLNPDFVITGGDLIMDALGQRYGRVDYI